MINLISRAAAGADRVAAAGAAGAAGAVARVVLGVVDGGRTAATGGAVGGAIVATAGKATAAGAVAAGAVGVGAAVGAGGAGVCAAARAGVVGATVFLPGVNATMLLAAAEGSGAALAAAVPGGTVAGAAGASGTAGATVGAAADCGSLLSALSVGPVAVGGVATAALATVDSRDVFPLPPRNSHADAATSARLATAIPMTSGIRDRFSATALCGELALTCIGLNGVGASDWASPNLANRSSANCTSSSGSAMLCASCETDAG